MNNQVGIAFSDTLLHTAFARDGQDLKIKAVPYPFEFSYETLFEERHLEALARILENAADNETSEETALSVSLPMSFVHAKKIALPLDADAELLQHQAEWELKNYLSGNLEEYKIINTRTEFIQGNYREIVFLAFKKEIISALQQLAELSKMTLKKIVPVNFLTADILQENNSENAFVLRLGKQSINSQLFIDGKYYISYIDSVKSGSIDLEQQLFEISKDRINTTEEMLRKLPFTQEKKLSFFIYGDGLTPQLEKQFEDQFTEPVMKLKTAQPEQFGSGLEAVQVLID